MNGWMFAMGSDRFGNIQPPEGSSSGTMKDRVLGIDPGTQRTGYGVIDYSHSSLVHVDNGVLKTNSNLDFPFRILKIYEGLLKVIQRYQPNSIAIEDVFHAKNVQSALKLGYSRGAALLAALKSGVPLYSYSPLEVKKAVVGFGRADKEQVQYMVKVLLRMNSSIPFDASDALAVAICHIHTGSTRRRSLNSNDCPSSR